MALDVLRNQEEPIISPVLMRDSCTRPAFVVHLKRSGAGNRGSGDHPVILVGPFGPL